MSASRRPGSLMVLILVAVLAVAGVWLAQRDRAPNPNLGGALFPVDATDIEGFLLTRGGLQYRFDRLPSGGWSLSGAANDYLDSRAMDAFVGMLPFAGGGPILPGTEIEDRRYEFNGPEAIRLRLFLRGGTDMGLAMGALNPVTGNYFASGVGRDGCFAVPAPFRDKLFMVPVTLQAKTLLPPLDSDLVQKIQLTRSGQVHQLMKRDDVWWLRLGDAGSTPSLAWLPPATQSYQRHYSDRSEERDDGVWIMASRVTVALMIYEVGETIVRDITSLRDSDVRLQQWELDPPWREVVLSGPGLNDDSSAPVLDQYTIGFGSPLSGDRVPAVRRGNALLTDLNAIGILNQGLDVLVEQKAMFTWALRADRLVLEREGDLLLEATRTGVAITDEGRAAWQTVFPPVGPRNQNEKVRHGLSQHLVVNLNRIEMLAALPATKEASVFTDDERLRMTLSWGQAGAVDQRELVLEAGYFDTEAWPADTFARTQDGGRPVGLWFPATGKLLQTSNYLLVNARSMRQYLPTESP